MSNDKKPPVKEVPFKKVVVNGEQVKPGTETRVKIRPGQRTVIELHL